MLKFETNLEQMTSPECSDYEEGAVSIECYGFLGLKIKRIIQCKRACHCKNYKASRCDKQFKILR